MIFRIAGLTFVVMACLAAQAADAAAFTKKQKLELLAAQNKYRIGVNEQPLAWSSDLAKGARAWARHLADDVHALQHSGEAGVGENLAMWTAGRASLTQLVDLWGAEKRYFVESSFPAVSTTGDWHKVGHYTQMIWRNTTEVGCGLATGGGYDFLVCRYAPQGNFMGEKVY
jgi:Cysteine-rich secretory protein family